MKTINSIILAAIAVSMVSCQMEINIEKANTTPEWRYGFPQQFSATIADNNDASQSNATKTVYDEDGKFKWLSSDHVRLIVSKDLGTSSPIGYFEFSIESLSNEDKSAVFTATNGTSGQLPEFNGGDWKSTGFAMYPISMLDRFKNTENHSYGAPWFQLGRGGYVSGKIEDTILIGTLKDGDDNYKFYSAMGVLKLTVNNIPAECARIKLCTAHKVNYPVDGDFAISKDGDGVPVLTFLTTWAADNNGYQAVDLSTEGFIDSKDFYFNIPAKSYAADQLSVVLEKSDGTAIVTKTIKKKLNISRNECLSFPVLNALPFVITEQGFAPRLRYHKTSSQKLRFDVNTVALTAENYNKSDWEDGNRFTNEYTNEDYYNIPVGSFGATGTYYLNYLVMTSDDTQPNSLDAENVTSYGSIPIYFIKSDTAANAITAVTVSSTETSTQYAGDNGGADALWDGNVSTYWHTKYNSGPDVRDDVYGAYVDVTLTNNITTLFQLKYNVRSTGNGQRPYKFVFGYSTDGSTFTRLPGYVSTTAMQNAAAGAQVTVPGIPIPESCKYIRIGVAESAQGVISSSSSGKYAAMAELEVYSY